MITAPVNKIIPFSSVDGPGNRTAVFFQGCNWDCCYCHNPETRNMCTGCMARSVLWGHFKMKMARCISSQSAV